MILTSPRAAAALALTALLGLTAACDGGASAVARNDEGDGRSGASAQAVRVDHRQDPAPLLDGKPLWAASRRYGAEDNAAYHFKRDGKAFGADSVEDYARMARAFAAAPPAGSEVVKRQNGDRLIYDPKGNVFAVATREGAPRAMFKPKDGAAYWAKQKAQGERRSARRDGDQADS